MKLRIAVIFFGFVLTGVVTTLLGPILPSVAVRWNLNDAQAGRLFTTQFVSAVLGSLVASRVLVRWGAAWTVSSGMLMVAAGVVAVGANSLFAGMIGISVYGVGLGFALPATNLLMAELMPEQRVSVLNLLNFSWTVGALAGPLLIASARKSIGFHAFLVLIAALLVIVGAFELFSLPKTISEHAPVRRGNLAPGKRVGFAIVTALFLLAYVGIENGFSGWLSALATRLHVAAPGTIAMMQSSFWAAILLGRVLVPFYIRRTTPAKVVWAGLGIAAIGLVITVTSGTIVMLEAGVLLCGIGLAAIFPTAVAIFVEWYGTGGAGSIVLGVCGVGGAIVPWLVGVVALRSQSLKAGFLVNLFGILLALLMFRQMQKLVGPQCARAVHDEAAAQ